MFSNSKAATVVILFIFIFVIFIVIKQIKNSFFAEVVVRHKEGDTKFKVHKHLEFLKEWNQ